MAFTPRLNSNGILGNRHWYSNDNPYYATGYGMPNCTAYAWGRFWEVGDPLSAGINKPDPYQLPGYWDGGLWWSKVDRNVYQTGQTPQLGAVICFERPGYAGHVAIVEQINNDGTIVTSNSAYSGTYFYTQTLSASNNYSWGTYVFQGFIYNPFGGDVPTPTNRKKSNFKWIFYARKIRNRAKLPNNGNIDYII